MVSRKPPWVPCPSNNPHCQGVEPPAASLSINDILIDINKLNVSEIVISFVILLLLIFAIAVIYEKTKPVKTI